MDHDDMEMKKIPMTELRGLLAAVSKRGKQHLDSVAKQQEAFCWLIAGHQLNKKHATKWDSTNADSALTANSSDIGGAVF